MKQLPIFFTFDNNYVVPAAVAFYSLLDKTKKNIEYKMYVLHSDISKENQKLLLSIIEKFDNASLEFVNTNGFLSEFWETGNFSYVQANSQFTVDTIIRCFGAKFFTQYEKIIYSDVDIIFMDDISALYDIDMYGKYIAGVKNPFMKYSEYELSHLKPEHYEMLNDKYIAGGIWVMNLKKIREDNLEEKMIEIIKDESIIKRWNDQDIINIACNGNVGFIPLNYISYPYLIDVLKKDAFVSDYTREELYDSILNPKIIHFAAGKPWNDTPNYSSLWWSYFYYLNLPKTSIIKNVVSKDIKKLRKYKKLFKIFLASSIGLFILGVLLALV